MVARAPQRPQRPRTWVRVAPAGPRRPRRPGQAASATERTKQGTPCPGCSQSFPIDELVFINHCYHADDKVQHRHRTCAGFRLLCSGCHLRMGTMAYYQEQLRRQAQERPEQYPWAACVVGMERYLSRLSVLVEQGVDPASNEQLEIAW